MNSQLKEANAALDMENKNRVLMQENLKKAFMRGVCALNLEAMSALNPASVSPPMDMFSTAPIDPGLLQQTPISVSAHDAVSEPSLVMEPKIESKDHMWKPAPILSRDFANSAPAPAGLPAANMAPAPAQLLGTGTTRIDGRSALLLDHNGDIGTAGEQEIYCERVQSDIDERDCTEGVEGRDMMAGKQSISVNQTGLMGMQQQPAEGKVIRVNKYGKSYADTSAKKMGARPGAKVGGSKVPMGDKKKSGMSTLRKK